MNVQDNHKNLAAEMAWRDAAILDEIRDAGYDGYVVNGKDLDVFLKYGAAYQFWFTNWYAAPFVLG